MTRHHIASGLLWTAATSLGLVYFGFGLWQLLISGEWPLFAAGLAVIILSVVIRLQSGGLELAVDPSQEPRSRTGDER